MRSSKAVESCIFRIVCQGFEYALGSIGNGILTQVRAAKTLGVYRPWITKNGHGLSWPRHLQVFLVI